MQTSHESRNKKLEMLLWSIALPGFGQLLNKHYIKGIFFVILEFIINVNGNFNTIIVLSFNGKTLEAVEQTNYLWLMFYPCLYFFAMWDAFRDAGGGKKILFLYAFCIFRLFCYIRFNFLSRTPTIWYTAGTDVAADTISPAWSCSWLFDSIYFA